VHIQKVVKMFLVRSRLSNLRSRVTSVQKAYRSYTKRDESVKVAAREHRAKRVEAAKTVQAGYKEFVRVRNSTRAALRPILRAEGVNRDAELAHYAFAQNVLFGSYRRVERKMSRAAVTIQRGVRTHLLGMDMVAVRKVKFAQSAITKGVV
jgi:hypothetical protein